MVFNPFLFFLDLVFPKFCVGCRKEGSWICKKCASQIILVKEPFCPECNRLTPKGQFCSRCRIASHLSGVIITAHYEEGPIKEAIHTFKYDGVFDLKYELSALLTKAIMQRNFTGDWLVLPVPLHKKRQAERGYNQSALLAQEIIKHFSNFTLNNKILIKIKNTQTQVSFKRKERLVNPVGAYTYVGKNNLNLNNILLVDDIYTTGATLQECAKVLRRHAKVNQIWGLVIAKG